MPAEPPAAPRDAARWSRRRALAFVLVLSFTLWGIIAAIVMLG